MKSLIGRRPASLLASTLALLSTLAVEDAFGMIQQEPGAVERAAEKLDEAGRQIKESLGRGFGTARDVVREANPAARPG